MISGEVEVNQLPLIRAILEAKFGEDLETGLKMIPKLGKILFT